MIRIYRDIQFSKDKSPYKTSVAAHVWHDEGKEDATPAYYLHLEPGGSSIGAGIWRPDARPLKKIRDAIVNDPKRCSQVTSAGELGYCKMSGNLFSARHEATISIILSLMILGEKILRSVCGFLTKRW